MKKIYSLALMAMMAVSAMMFTSCGNDDEEVSKDFTISIEFTQVLSIVSENTYVTIKNYYQNLLGNDVSIAYGTGPSAIITIQGDASKKDATVSAVRNTDTDALTKALEAAGIAESFTFIAYDGSTKYYEFTYEVSAKDALKGKTWTATYNNVKYTFVVEDKQLEEYKYKATMTEAGNTFEGFFQDYDGIICYFVANPPEGGNTPLTFEVDKTDITSTEFPALITSQAYSLFRQEITFTAQ